LCLLVVACLAVFGVAPMRAATTPTTSATPTNPDPGAGDTLAMDWGAVPEYRIVPGDLLAINFGPGENSTVDLYRTQRVRPDGRISMFPVGDVVAAGRTPRELETILVKLLSAELRNPRLAIEITEFAGNQVHILGRVKDPGSYPAGPFLTVLQAVAKAGGFQDDAARNSIIVFHRNGAHTVQVARLRLDNAIKVGDLSADLPLSRFDIVYVPRSTIGNVNVFAYQFFTAQQGILNFAFSGWELFNLDRIYGVRGPASNPPTTGSAVAPEAK
jgi:polysaccharide export outer membrane protein